MLLGGSFDPVHNAHVALGSYFARLLVPDELRIIPAGNPWQKDPLNASAADRVAMLRLAFDRHRLSRKYTGKTAATPSTRCARCGPRPGRRRRLPS